MFQTYVRPYVYSTLILLTGCASYNSSTLPVLSSHDALYFDSEPQILVSWKIYNARDCENYLDRNILSEGYIPVQLTVRNQGNDPLYLSAHNFSVPLCSSREVASKAHTSTGGRIAAWGVGGLFFFPLMIPAVVDGMKSVQANTDLDADYAAKTLKEQVIQPHSLFNGIVFIPKKYQEEDVEMFLVNQKTGLKVGCYKIPLSSIIRPRVT